MALVATAERVLYRMRMRGESPSILFMWGQSLAFGRNEMPCNSDHALLFLACRMHYVRRPVMLSLVVVTALYRSIIFVDADVVFYMGILQTFNQYLRLPV